MPGAGSVAFDGTTASALNKFLSGGTVNNIRVTASALTVDEPILVNGDGITIDFGTAQITAQSTLPYMVRVEGAHNAAILGGSYLAGNSAILVNKSANVLIDHASMSGLIGDGVVLVNSSHVFVSNNQITGLNGPGIIVGAGTSLSSIVRNDVSSGGFGSNWTAGIVLSDRDVDLVNNPRILLFYMNFGPDLEPIRNKLNPPRDCLIAWNRLVNNVSGGIYTDGATRMVIFANYIVGNAKEGICLDNGATANVVASNIFQHNGNRWGQTDRVLALDFSLARLPDGTAASKLPGVSMDNAMYNVVYGNNISHNYGDGIKTVRTSFFNVMAQNIIESDNDGANVAYRFFGIFLGAIYADAPAPDLDFTGSRGNLIFSNTIRGSHASGFYIQLGSEQNQIFENTIKDVELFAIESVLLMDNTFSNNLTDKPSQNASDTCCIYPRVRSRTIN